MYTYSCKRDIASITIKTEKSLIHVYKMSVCMSYITSYNTCTLYITKAYWDIKCLQAAGKMTVGSI